MKRGVKLGDRKMAKCICDYYLSGERIKKEPTCKVHNNKLTTISTKKLKTATKHYRGL